MLYHIQLNVLPSSLEAAKGDIEWLCGSAEVEKKTERGIEYYAISGIYEGDAEKFEPLKYNWNTYAHPGDPLYGVLGFNNV